MKANKAFYEKLRADVGKEAIQSHVLLLWVSNKEDKGETKKKLTDNNANVVELQEKIKGLKSQVELLEKRNKELVEENNKLRRPTSEQPIKIMDMVDTKEGGMDILWGIAIDQYKQMKNNFTKGYISIEHMLNWAYNDCGDDHYISTTRNMLQDFEWKGLITNDDYREHIKTLEKKKRERTQTPVIKELVLNKKVENEIHKVEKGANGVVNNK